MKYSHQPFSLFFFAILLSSTIVLTNGCSTTASTNGDNVTMTSQLATSDVDRAMEVKGATPQVLTFQSIVITNVVVFVKDVKLHSDEDSLDKDDHDQNIKTGPFVLVFDSTGSHVVSNVAIPNGAYDRIKFEIHKPDPNNSDDATVLATYPQLQSGNQTYTVWIYGYTVNNGIKTAFTVRSNKSQNLTLKFKDDNDNDQNNITISSAMKTLAFEFDPRLVFHVEDGAITGTLFDPRDSGNQSHIDDHIVIAIKVVEF